MKRRQFFMGSALALASTASPLFLRKLADASPQQKAARLPIMPTCPTDGEAIKLINAQMSRIAGVHACTRPFRHAGPRIEAELLGSKLVVHNYGHGGSGWSLSWGSSMQALRMAQAATPGLRTLGVIGCGPLGLTSALLAQHAGLSVRIYAKALPPNVSSMGATGLWSPDSRFCDLQHEADWAARWNEMARTSFDKYQQTAGLPGRLVEWFNGYKLSDTPFPVKDLYGSPPQTKDEDEPEYARFANDFLPPQIDLLPGGHPFPTRYARCWTSLMFNITPYASKLVADFLAAGGKVDIRAFNHPNELLTLPECTFINATGYGAKALFNDETVIPVRGQTVRLMPQPEVIHGLRAEQFLVMPRRDGLIVQNMDETGNFNNSNDAPDLVEAKAILEQAATFIARIG
ncbi:FAD-binding oxidoreductase [Pseudomonas sp. 17391]|jgi:2-polyprenyl-6-methoxyphenol hydroxylase and related FAD-dependent oxidoreductases|uniref:FAD-dependent oxidoreductase n=1 Tax=Pseudomonas TaxID=286 RepID=UPI000513D8E8|nr:MULTISPECIES: FAD-dependent oxidoreductase [Pseudomonas]KGI92204.1 hypothetical protein MD26_16030 [Pseudomonas sp. H2]MDD1959491.1 FAD-binding oxidoreductase [Pseudomonas sp. 39004]MDD2066010.1 FAD-binding oxidoreductase [Pseudomonas sp. 25571]MDD2131751.1 FAD-binding oxidoreductase [Pseudomonas sp. 17391]UDU83737.1 FAD-binding oxidoreductase [Pseudomonas sp. HN2-3]